MSRFFIQHVQIAICKIPQQIRSLPDAAATRKDHNFCFNAYLFGTSCQRMATAALYELFFCDFKTLGLGGHFILLLRSLVVGLLTMAMFHRYVCGLVFGQS